MEKATSRPWTRYPLPDDSVENADIEYGLEQHLRVGHAQSPQLVVQLELRGTGMDDIEDIRTQGMRLFDESQPIHAPQADIDNGHAYFAQGSQRLFTAAHGQDGKAAVFEVSGDIDIMFIDMPPGTGDVPLSVFQSIPLDGIILTTSPQELVTMIVGKAVTMAQIMNIPVLGIVENMSYVECPCCGAKIEVFGRSRVDELAAQYNIDYTAQIPFNSKIAAGCDSGNMELFEGSWLDRMLQVIMA